MLPVTVMPEGLQSGKVTVDEDENRFLPPSLHLMASTQLNFITFDKPSNVRTVLCIYIAPP